jgi:RNA polymerase sigma-70 factor (ECF subfamily)
MRNRLADEARRHARTSAHEVAMDDLDVTFSSRDANPLYEGFGDPEALHQAIEALPAGQRQAIELLEPREMSLKEAAAVSGTTVGALTVATHRAMAALGRLLTNK